MRKIVTLILLLVVLTISCNYAIAENLTEMSIDELLNLRLLINNELASRNTLANIPEGTAIADLFPDHIMAMKVRDAIGAISTEDPVTQEELDSVKTLFINGNSVGETHELQDLTGIEYLRNLEILRIVSQPDCTEIPDSIRDCVHLRELDFRSCGIKSLPAGICDLAELEEIIVNYSELETLPEDIGNLQSLKVLDISYTNVTSLPSSIRNLNLDKFSRDGLDID